MAKRQALNGVSASLASQIAMSVGGAKASVIASIEQQRAAVQAGRQQHKATIAATIKTETARLGTEASEISSSVRQTARTLTMAADRLGEAQAQRARTESASQSAMARTRGEQKAASFRDSDAERARAQADAARQVASSQAAKIDDAAPDLATFAREKSHEIASGFGGKAAQLAAEIDRTATQSQPKLQELGTTISGQIDTIAETVLGSLNNLQTQTIVQLDSLSNAALTQAAKLQVEATPAVDTNESAALDQITSVARDATAKLQSSTREAAVRLATGQGRASQSREKVALALDAQDKTTQATATAMDTVGTAMRENLESVIGLATSGATALEGQVNTATSTAVQVASSMSANSAGKAIAGMQTAAGGAATTSKDAVNQLLAKLRESGKKSESEFTTTFDKGKAQVEAGVTKGLGENDHALIGLDAKMTEAAAKAAEEYDRPWWKKALYAIGKALAYLVIAIVVTIALAAIIAFVAGIAFASALAIAVVALAVAFVGYEFYTRLQAYRAEHGPVGSIWEALGISAALLGISIASITGIPQIIEGFRGQRFFSDIKLSEQERYDLVIGGFLQLVLLVFGGKVMRGPRSRGEPPGGARVRQLPEPGRTGETGRAGEPSRTSEPGRAEEPGGTKEPGRTEERGRVDEPGRPAEPARPYEPTARTDEQLAMDRDPTPRPGETADQAQARSRAAEAEMAVREAVQRYDALGDRPPRVNVRAQEAANGGHTIERHAPDIPLRRGDAPAGARTVEGRIYGDPPWGDPQNFSYKWIDEPTMNRVVNNYLRNNWEAIRSDLALNGRHEATFDSGNLAGEGFSNSSFGTPNPPNAVYSRTSVVTITLELILGRTPAAFRILRAFPNGRGF
jgi:hypothetical protein